MSDVSQFVKEQKRPLHEEERALLSAFLKSNVPPCSSAVLDTARVVDMQDGGMGSIRFVQQAPRRYGKTLAERYFVDEDGLPVSITLNVDEQGDLFELDFWKVDFTPLRHYPSPSEATAEPLYASGFRQSA